MALKADRTHIDSQIDFFMNTAADRGGIVSISTVGSGAAMDQAEQLCLYATGAATIGMSGVKPLGILMNDVVDLDLTRQHINWHKDEVQKGGKVTIWSKGTVVTNMIYPGQTPTAGQHAYVSHSGYIANAKNATDDGDFEHIVGTFLSTKDADGYCKVSVNLPR